MARGRQRGFESPSSASRIEPEAEHAASQVVSGKRVPAQTLSGSPIAPARAPAPEPSTAPAQLGLLVPDEAVPGAHQLRRAEFLALLRRATCETAASALAGSAWTADNCPWIVYWFDYYEGRGVSDLERAALKYAPEAATATTADELLALLTARVGLGMLRWRQGDPAEMSTAPGEPPGAAGGLAQLMRHDGAPAEAANLALRPGGARLEGETLSRMESAFGDDFRDVRVHTDGHAQALSRQLDARAFTVGPDIAFGQGQYAPGTMGGDLLLAHELAHVVQQRGGAGRAPGMAAAHEHEANQAATSAVSEGHVRARPASGQGLTLSRCSKKDEPPVPISDPSKATSYQDWLKSFPGYTASGGDAYITDQAPPALKALITGSAGVTPDCADVSILLRHYYLKSHGETQTITAGDQSFKIGKGVSDKDVGKVLDNVGTVHFQEDRKDHRLVKWHKKAGAMITNLKQLIDAGLGPGELLVWKRLDSVQGNFEGHVQTVQSIDLAAKTITVVQGNMSHGVGVGRLEQRQKTFAQLTGDPDGNADIKPATEEFFYGAGPWL
jgi:hypothetical protein